MTTVRCKCGAQRTIAGEVEGRPLLSMAFALLDAIDVNAAGWSLGPDGRWRCDHCTRRARLVRALPPENKPDPKNE